VSISLELRIEVLCERIVQSPMAIPLMPLSLMRVWVGPDIVWDNGWSMERKAGKEPETCSRWHGHVSSICTLVPAQVCHHVCTSLKDSIPFFASNVDP